MEVVPPMLGRGLAVVTEGFLAFKGVVVRVFEVLGAVEVSCFVGDLVGDCSMVLAL